MSQRFQFPVSDFAEALHVLNPNTELDVLENDLYVNLDPIRSDSFRRKILNLLGIANGQFIGIADCNDKILLTGHRGSGKSVELERMAETLDRFYLTVTINIEKELLKLSSITPEDLYQLLIIQLFECLDRNDVPFNKEHLTDLIRIWDVEKSEETSSSNKQTLEAGGGFESGISAWIVSLKARLVASVTAESDETAKTRRRIKTKINEILAGLNTQLAEVRQHLRSQGRHGVVFIIDGTEKIPYDIARTIFVLDAPILQQINAPVIMASPILGAHDIDGGVPYFNNQMFPMAKLDREEKVALFKQILTKRVHEEALFEPGVLDCAARKSGGGIRQLLQIAREALLNRRGERVTMAELNDALYELGLGLWRRLDRPHKEVLRSGTNDYDFGNETVRQMLFSLVLLAQNGHAAINPLLQPFVDGSDNCGCA